jgi:diguanylate cyclase (GGDEF)-like protein/PAS domain S-box-containing protein
MADWRMGAWLGGAMVGGGIAAMHYTGMAAFEIQGRIEWDAGLVAASIVLGGLIGAFALPVGLRGAALKWKILGALLLTLAICSHHFTAMGAAAIVPDPTIELSAMALPSGWLAMAVALASLVIIALALTGVAIEMRSRRRTQLEFDRMQGLANAAVEGLLVCDGDVIVTVNNSFARLVGAPAEALTGVKLAQFFPDEDMRRKLIEQPNQSIEGELMHVDGSTTPAEMLLRPIDYGGRPHHVVAVRDLQARKRAEQHIRYLAHHDSLTGVPNRDTFNKALDHEIDAALRTGKRLAVVCLDLDRFKEVNDLFGHAAGDAALQTVAKKIAGVLGEGQMLARLSGDEFAVMMPNLSHPTMAGRLAEDILKVLRAEETEAGAPIGTSIGVAICPEDASDRHSLLSHADTALYRAKKEGRGTYRFFEAAMGAAVRDRRLLEHDLRNAIPRQELRLV